MATEAGRVLRICLGPAISPSCLPPPPRMEHGNKLKEERRLPQKGKRQTSSPRGKPLNSRLEGFLPAPELLRSRSSWLLQFLPQYDDFLQGCPGQLPLTLLVDGPDLLGSSVKSQGSYFFFMIYSSYPMEIQRREPRWTGHNNPNTVCTDHSRNGLGVQRIHPDEPDTVVSNMDLRCCVCVGSRVMMVTALSCSCFWVREIERSFLGNRFCFLVLVVLSA